MSNFPNQYSRSFIPYQPPNEGDGLITVDRDLAWRLSARGLVTPAVIGAISWARNNFEIPAAKHQAILKGLGLRYRQLPSGTTFLQPQDRYLHPPSERRNPEGFFNLVQPQLPLHHYDAIEVYPCVETPRGVERYESKEHPDLKPQFWSVALHLEIGHIETVADFPTERQAETFGLVMTDLIRTAREVQGLDTSLLYAK